jgi:DNA-binding transcriptional ArsR family regulator
VYSTRDQSIDTRMPKAMSHPVRVRSLSILNERIASPSEIAEELGLPVANVAYHVRTLLQLKCIEEVDARPVRGALEHFYRATRRALYTLDDCEAMPANARHAFAIDTGERIREDYVAALNSDTFDERADHHLSWTPVRLDDEGWKNVYAVLLDALNKVIAEEAKAAARLQDGASGGSEIRTRVAILQYPAPPPKS